ncbi:polysaccharide biosynthesis tyrosine autokinase [Pseudomonas sp. 10B1]|uniref:polysaccharide biosynthesis tyrosine autokinase n=1 Tax=unclassified Pseudomonas TaxID=196821 RepID=UPI002AB42825|nr:MULTISPECIES: polysaccharide biosynthesis tyrosine autokinase [unclassified Pseudomonas]MDY7559570.1 polysaccharide biosynthesis tyrosine autokinase [Pseudomonas sp. AB6]MEA9977521.1 polysaccharide biosynthesis tyrosine autokinase [Pseudomonas sp. RTS4]MEA9996424.1 polysaccharide biosynthesis tyrosine autokinase [Pseudomonas sp. AA4]MEB0088073.1 polysaccharide biosynthesis tyrosine autokinase [Pseudomonas sp. RTI1]MEB0126900.1 polysaccharide biosynthesis tyrosine autokinase [Pseudomonas sp.
MTVMNRPALDYYQDTKIDLATVLRTLFDHKGLIASIVSVFLLVGLAYALLATPIYQGNAMIQIEPKKIGIEGTPEVNNKPLSVSQATTEIELIKSRAVLGKVVEDLKLNIIQRPNYFPVFGAYMARTFKPDMPGALAEPVFGLRNYAWGGEHIDVFQLEVSDALLGQKLTLVANGADAFSLFDKDGGVLLNGQTNQTVEGNGVKIQIATLKARPGTEFTLIKQRTLTSALDYQSRLTITEAGKDSGIIYLSIQDPDPVQAKTILDEVSHLYVRQNVERSSAEAAQRLEFLRSQLPLVRKQLEQSEQALNAFQASAKSVDLSIETKSVLDQVVNLDSMLSELKLKRVEIERLYTPEHPTYRALMTQMGQLESQKQALLKKIQALPVTQQELLRLTRDMQVTTQTYTLLLNKSQEQDILRAGSIGNVRIIDNADANVEEPAKPMRKLIVALATLLGVLVAVIVVFLRQAFYRGVDNPEIIENLGMPVYASLPYSRQQERLEKNNQSRAAKLLSVSEPTELAVESLRSLRTSLHFAMLEARNNVLMISSPTPASGKSFVSSNLAVIIAQTGKRVLLIDADMRKGYLHKIFGLQPKHGLSDTLAARLTSKDVINATEVPNLDLISCGFAAPNPSELLMHDNFNKLLADLAPLYDLVIVDTPPILAVTDATLVGRQAGTTLLVTRFGLTSVKEIEACKRRLGQNGVVIKGAIFNGVLRKASTASYDCAAYGYDYSPTRK